MRIELTFQLKKAELLKDNKSCWLSFLKSVLSSCNGGKYFEKYFGTAGSNDYCFSIIMPNPEFAGEKILLSDSKIKMLFSADDRNKTGLIFYAAFIQSKRKWFPLPDDNAMLLIQVREIQERAVTGSKVLFNTVTGGGLVVREHHSDDNKKDHYYSYQDEGFGENLKRVLKHQALHAGFSEYQADHILVIPMKCRNVFVKQYGIYVNATIGTFLMEGDPELLQYFYKAGIGSKHSMGYGMIDLIPLDQ